MNSLLKVSIEIAAKVAEEANNNEENSDNEKKKRKHIWEEYNPETHFTNKHGNGAYYTEEEKRKREHLFGVCIRWHYYPKVEAKRISEIALNVFLNNLKGGNDNNNQADVAVASRADDRDEDDAGGGGEDNITTRLGQEGTGYIRYFDNDYDYGRREVIDLMQDVARIWHGRHPDSPIRIGDISQRGGGGLDTHFGFHANGVEVDIMYMATGGGRWQTNPGYNRALTIELLTLIIDQTPTHGLEIDYFLFNDDLVHNALPGIFQDHNPAMHDNHIHLQWTR